MSMDFSEVVKLSASLGAVGSRLPKEARAIVTKGAVNVKKDARATVSNHPSWRRLEQTINYDLKGNAFFSEATVGYDDVGQGELAGIYEFGSARRGPHPTLYPAAEREAPRFEAAMLDAAAKLVEDAL